MRVSTVSVLVFLVALLVHLLLSEEGAAEQPVQARPADIIHPYSKVVRSNVSIVEYVQHMFIVYRTSKNASFIRTQEKNNNYLRTRHDLFVLNN